MAYDEGMAERVREAMTGFVLVEPDGLEDDADLARWVDTGAARASALPPK